MSKRKTHDEYVEELKIKNPTVEVIDKYIDAKTKILHHCLIHDIYWHVLPGNVLAGKGCCECAKDKNKKKFTKTHEEYIKELKNINSNIVVLEKYINSHTPILHKCIKHNFIWKVLPTSILSGSGCPKCKSEKISNLNFKTHEQYVEELKNKNPHVFVVEKYCGCDKAILHYCKHHNTFWNVAPRDILKGRGCPKCKSDIIKASLGKSPKEYMIEVKNINPNIEVVGTYSNMKTKILHHCLIHDLYWETTPQSILQGSGCPKCKHEKISQATRFSSDEYNKLLLECNSNVIAVEEYITIKTPIKHKCLIHNYEWTTTPSSILQGCGCPICRSEKISQAVTKSHEEYIEILKNKNPDIIVLEQYINTYTPILHKCIIDDYEWYAKPCNVLSGTGCPICNESRGERSIRQWLEKHNIDFEMQKTFNDCKNIRPLPFDFYLPQRNVCIEYDGKQHFEPVDHFGGINSFKHTVSHDEVKNNYCKDNGISLLRIPYFKNIEEELNNFLFI